MIGFPHTVDNFLSTEENQILLDCSTYCDLAFDTTTESVTDLRWKSRVAYMHIVEQYDSAASQTMYNVGRRIHEYFKKIQPALNIHTEIPQFSRWQPGDKLDPPHIDAFEYDGSDNATPWRHYGYILYLNDDFEGGELFYPNYNLDIKPRPRMLAVHTAGPDCMHGVRMVTKGRRHTLIGFASINQEHYDENKLAYIEE